MRCKFSIFCARNKSVFVSARLGLFASILTMYACHSLFPHPNPTRDIAVPRPWTPIAATLRPIIDSIAAGEAKPTTDIHVITATPLTTPEYSNIPNSINTPDLLGTPKPINPSNPPDTPIPTSISNTPPPDPKPTKTPYSTEIPVPTDITVIPTVPNEIPLPTFTSTPVFSPLSVSVDVTDPYCKDSTTVGVDVRLQASGGESPYDYSPGQTFTFTYKGNGHAKGVVNIEVRSADNQRWRTSIEFPPKSCD